MKLIRRLTCIALVLTMLFSITLNVAAAAPRPYSYVSSVTVRCTDTLTGVTAWSGTKTYYYDQFGLYEFDIPEAGWTGAKTIEVTVTMQNDSANRMAPIEFGRQLAYQTVSPNRTSTVTGKMTNTSLGNNCTFGGVFYVQDTKNGNSPSISTRVTLYRG